MPFSHTLARLRKAEHLTQKKLAQLLGVSDKAVSRWENGQSMPSTKLLPQLADVLHVSVNALLRALDAQEEALSPAYLSQETSPKRAEVVRMNFIPNKQPGSCNYVCTWGIQNRLSIQLGLVGTGLSEARDVLDARYLLEEDVYHIMPKEYRSGLILLLDDGWDVPYGTPHTEESGPFGEMAPAADKFAGLGKTGVERLCNLSRKVKEMGYQGLGLWVSPQMPYQEGEPTPEDARAYWEERARWSAQAGVAYWKVDWGKSSRTPGYREMMTECVRKYAPGLVIEHGYEQGPLEGTKSPEDPITEKMCHVFAFSDVLRTYDVCKPFYDSATICRANAVLSRMKRQDFRLGAMGMLNVESSAMVAAGLGLNVGIMRYEPIMEAALRWQRLSPAFSVMDAPYLSSEETVCDFFHFDVDPAFWFKAAGQSYSLTLPVALSRGTALPTVESSGEKPVVLAHQNPQTGAFAVAALRRTIDPNADFVCLADVTVSPETWRHPIGIFGYYRSLNLRFAEDLPQGCRVWAQCLLSDNAVDITDEVSMDETTLTLDGLVIRKHGIHSGQTDPALLIVIR